MPPSGSDTLIACTGVLTDNGGAGNYSNNASGVLTILPGSSSSFVRLGFTTFNLDGCCDSLEIFNGPNVMSPRIGRYLYSPEVVQATNPSGALTLRFRSNSTYSYSGFQADISCVQDSAITDLTMKETILTSVRLLTI